MSLSSQAAQTIIRSIHHNYVSPPASVNDDDNRMPQSPSIHDTKSITTDSSLSSSSSLSRSRYEKPFICNNNRSDDDNNPVRHHGQARALFDPFNRIWGVLWSCCCCVSYYNDPISSNTGQNSLLSSSLHHAMTSVGT